MLIPEPEALNVPVEEWRDGQDVLIRAVVEQWKQDKIVLLEAPTGSGKSVVAVAALRMMEMQEGIKATPAVVTTSTVALEQQYINSLHTHSVHGRDHYVCPKFNVSVANAPCTAGYECKNKWAVCPYYQAKQGAVEKGRITVTNLTYLLSEMNYASYLSGKFQAFIGDEAHLMESNVMSFTAVQFSRKVIKRMGYPVPPDTEDLDEIKAWANTAIPVLQVDIDNLLGLADDLTKEQIAVLNRRTGLMSRLKAVTKAPSDWLVQSDKNAVTVRPVWLTAAHIQNILWRHFPRHVHVLLMSATLGDDAVISDILHFPKDHVMIRAGSTFPVERRPLVLWPAFTLNYKAMNNDTTVNRLIAAIDKLLDEMPDWKGVILTPNYKFTAQLAQRSRHKDRLVTHLPQMMGGYNFRDRSEAVRITAASPRPLVLATPSMFEGLDFREGKFVIIPKTPWPSLGDKFMAARAQDNPAYYAMTTALRVVQGSGRTMRSADDKSVAIILDAQFQRLLHFIPGWWKQALAIASNYDQVAGVIRGLRNQ